MGVLTFLVTFLTFPLTFPPLTFPPKSCRVELNSMVDIFMSRNVGLVVFLVALVIVLFAWKSQEEVGLSPPVVPLGNEDGVTQPEQPTALDTNGAESEDEGGLSDSETSQSRTSASKITHVPDAQDSATTHSKQSLATDKVKLAVKSRDVKLAVDAFMQFGGCRKVVFTDSGMERRNKILGSAYENMVMSTNSPISYDEIISSQDQMRTDCETLNRDKIEFLDRELADEANNGNQIARFIYAMWSPNDEFGLQLGEEWIMEYEVTALEFTLENLNEGHPLGLYALGLSYSTGEYFTSQRVSLGSAMLIASNMCSGGQFNIDSQLGLNGLVLRAKAKLHPVATEELMLERSTQMYEAYCDRSITNTTK